MRIVRYDPWGLLQRFQEDIGRTLAESGAQLPVADDSNVVTSRWAPAVDIREEDDRFVLEADVPGVDPKDIEITMENGLLTIKGERSDEHEEERNGYRRVERVHGSFYRRFSLPDTANADEVSAHGKNGVLEVTIPKQEKVKPRRISVK